MAASIAALDELLTAPDQWIALGEERVRGVPTRVWKNAPPSLPAVLEASRAFGDDVFLVYEDERVTFVEHTMVSGETLSHIARRYRVTIDDLHAANPTVRSCYLSIGSTFIVPIGTNALAAGS